MANLNHVVLIGRLTRDAELKYTNTGAAVSKFSLAVNRRRRSGDQWIEEANYFDIVLWGKTAEVLSQYLIKGKEIALEGELHQNRWEQDGHPRSKVEIIANTIQLLGSARGSGQQTSGDYSGKSSQGDQADTPDSDFDDDIPF